TALHSPSKPTPTSGLSTLSLHDALPLFLGLRTLTIIDWAVKAINSRDRGPGTGDPGKAGGVPLDITALPLDDKTTYELFARGDRSEEHTSELQSRENLVCRLLLEKKKKF